MLNRMSPDQPSPQVPTRLQTRGKLSFRRRLRHVPSEDTPGLPYIALSEQPPRLDEIVPEGFAKVEIEVGPGKGAFLSAATGACPETFFLGIEAAPSYAVYSAERMLREGRDNAVLLVDNALIYLQEQVDDGAIHRLHVYFADPWPKRRHKKRRLFTPGVDELLARVLEPGGLLLIATDNAAYAGQICTIMGAAPDFVRDTAIEQELPPGHGFSPTNFEKKYREEQRIIRRYAYRRN